MTMTKTNDTMLERVARAIYVNDPGYDDEPWDRMSPHSFARETCLAQARAAICAMRTPTKAMEAAREKIDMSVVYADIWPAMIDAALGETP